MNSTVYCPGPSCRALIPPRQVQAHIGTCERCGIRVCILCRGLEHLPNTNCRASIIPDYAVMGIKAEYEASVAKYEKQELDTQLFLSRLITQNAKAIADIPGSLGEHVIEKYKADLRARHFVLEDAIRACRADMQANYAKLRENTAAALAFKQG